MILQYIDDTLLFVKIESELLDVLETYFEVLLRYNVKLYPGKFVIYSKEIEWGDNHMSAAGVGPSPNLVKAVQEMPEPQPHP